MSTRREVVGRPIVHDHHLDVADGVADVDVTSAGAVEVEGVDAAVMAADVTAGVTATSTASP